MDYQIYKEKYFAHPQPEPRFEILGLDQVALFIHDYQAALDYYSTVLGPPAYIEGTSTHGWQLGDNWLTLFPAKSGNPHNLEFTIKVATPEVAERLQQAFIVAGGTGDSPSDQFMYQAVRYCRVNDPFGTEILIISPLSSFEEAG